MNDPIRSALAPWHHHWLTVREFSRMMGRSERQVQKWTHDGTLADFGYPIYVSSPKFGGRPRFFIRFLQ